MTGLAILGAFLPRLDDRGGFGRAFEIAYLWFNAMAALCLVGTAAGALRVAEPREVVLVWLLGILVLRAPELLGRLLPRRPAAAPAAPGAAPAARSRPAPSGRAGGFASPGSGASSGSRGADGGFLGTRRAGHRGRIVGRT